MADSNLESLTLAPVPLPAVSCCCACMLSHISCVWLFATIWTVAPPDSSVHGILQAIILEWVVISSSRGSSQTRDRTCISCIGRRILYHWATWKALAICIKRYYKHFILFFLVPSCESGISLIETSLVVQWLRFHTPNSGAQVWSLVRELDPTCYN